MQTIGRVLAWLLSLGAAGAGLLCSVVLFGGGAPSALWICVGAALVFAALANPVVARRLGLAGRWGRTLAMQTALVGVGVLGLWLAMQQSQHRALRDARATQLQEERVAGHTLEDRPCGRTPRSLALERSGEVRGAAYFAEQGQGVSAQGDTQESCSRPQFHMRRLFCEWTYDRMTVCSPSDRHLLGVTLYYEDVRDGAGMAPYIAWVEIPESIPVDGVEVRLLIDGVNVWRGNQAVIGQSMGGPEVALLSGALDRGARLSVEIARNGSVLARADISSADLAAARQRARAALAELHTANPYVSGLQ